MRQLRLKVDICDLHIFRVGFRICGRARYFNFFNEISTSLQLNELP